ncbi:uncharacterized protein KY384_008115 [Bacidia gigantensis]|uniref:uncharacterized protein n=1 Tax=Bacidia gigantensis TaxID=2732470 RepID=UPI001D04DB63|nr:uncharacterized protein KY384_008115 [Bacidia gigantensis]KAG8526686.1 hypothetical protein KY384_008115 [Bacidia gigantensis]
MPSQESVPIGTSNDDAQDQQQACGSSLASEAVNDEMSRSRPASHPLQASDQRSLLDDQEEANCNTEVLETPKTRLLRGLGVNHISISSHKRSLRCAFMIFKKNEKGKPIRDSELFGNPYFHNARCSINGRAYGGEQGVPRIELSFTFKQKPLLPNTRSSKGRYVTLALKFKSGVRIGNGYQLADFRYIPFDKVHREKQIYVESLDTEYGAKPNLRQKLAVFYVETDGCEMPIYEAETFASLPEEIVNVILRLINT